MLEVAVVLLPLSPCPHSGAHLRAEPPPEATPQRRFAADQTKEFNIITRNQITDIVSTLISPH